jgi:hypothetical protein
VQYNAAMCRSVCCLEKSFPSLFYVYCLKSCSAYMSQFHEVPEKCHMLDSLHCPSISYTVVFIVLPSTSFLLLHWSGHTNISVLGNIVPLCICYSLGAKLTDKHNFNCNILVLYSALPHVSTFYISHHQVGVLSQI